MTTLNCDAARERLDAYLDGELPEEQQNEMASHITDCPACTAEALAGTQLRITIRAAGRRFVAGPELRSRVEAALSARGRRSERVRWFSAIAAALLVGLSTGILVDRGALRENGDPFVDRLVDTHATLLGGSNPIEVASSDRHTVKPWFQGRLPFSFAVPELSGTAFSLRGGRVVFVGGTQAAYLLFDLRQHHVALFVLPEDASHRSGPSTGRRSSTRHGLHVETWSAGDLRYVALGDASAEDIATLHRLIAQSS